MAGRAISGSLARSSVSSVGDTARLTYPRLRWPNPFPTWFGFHEIFHAFTIAAFVCHYVAASIATYQLR